ncbi:MAG TPA: hypothetical protein VF649_12890 [Sphingomonas sp.]|jgi:hypothetical protein|uniref:hypothetical protein n=1 Tax=Sphingomonas sp. TaxID=28214 RepID=UPI002EDB3899
MTPEDMEKLAMTRFAIISAVRASGVVLMLFGLWIWYGDLLDTGGNWMVGMPLFVLGMAESMLLPRYLIRGWRSPPQP